MAPFQPPPGSTGQPVAFCPNGLCFYEKRTVGGGVVGTKQASAGWAGGCGWTARPGVRWDPGLLGYVNCGEESRFPLRMNEGISINTYYCRVEETGCGEQEQTGPKPRVLCLLGPTVDSYSLK